MGRIADFTTGTYTGITPANVNSTGGYVEDNSGALTWIAANTLRRSNKGLLVEPSATNILLNSSTAGWGQFTTGVTTQTPNNAVAPDGTTTATKVDLFRAGGTQWALVSQDITGASGSHIPSIWLKAASSGDIGKRVEVALHSGSSKTLDYITLTANWVRYTAGTQTAPVQMFVGWTGSGWPGTGDVGAVAFFMWGGQAELGSVPSSLIPTTSAAATRSADAVSFTTSGSVTQLTYTFDDNSTQNVSVTGGASHTIPTNLNRAYIKFIDDNASSGNTANASGSIDLTGTTAGTVKVTAAATGALGLTGSSTVGIAVTASAQGSLGFTGSGAYSVATKANVAGSLALTGAVAATVSVKADVSGTIELTGFASSGTAALTANIAGSFDLTGAAVVAVKVSAQASGALALSGAAVIASGVNAAVAGTLPLVGSGAARVALVAASSGVLNLTGSAVAFLDFQLAGDVAPGLIYKVPARERLHVMPMRGNVILFKGRTR